MKQEPYPLIPTNEWETEEDESTALQEFVEGMGVIAHGIGWAFRKGWPAIAAVILAVVVVISVAPHVN